jgi:ribA/ribD-fused uncharacterized protein
MNKIVSTNLIDNKQIINEFRYTNSFLSNFSKNSVVYSEILFKTSEHAYQWAKCETDDDRIVIINCDTATQAKKYGRSIKCNLIEWNKNKVNIMENIIRSKFSNIKLKAKLINTGDSELIEGNYWHDAEWGKCFCLKCKNKEGKNFLGKILMKIRLELKNN